MSTYTTEYALKMVKQSVDHAEIEDDFVPLRKWINELSKAIEEEKELKELQDDMDDFLDLKRTQEDART